MKRLDVEGKLDIFFEKGAKHARPKTRKDT